MHDAIDVSKRKEGGKWGGGMDETRTRALTAIFRDSLLFNETAENAISSPYRRMMRSAIQTIEPRITHTGHIGPIPLKGHWHLPQILGHERLLERAHIQRRGPVRGKLGVEVRASAGLGRAHHV